MSNQFNTAANGGIGPLSTIHVRSRLIVDLLFADQICIPGTSLLCNPATLKMLAEEAAFFEGLLTDRKVVAILENDTASFADLADKLVAINSAALTTIGLPVSAARRAAREAANYLDQTLSASQILRVKEDDLALIRTATTRTMIERIPNLMPSFPEAFQTQIRICAAKEIDRKGTISESWWVNTVKDEIPELRYWDSQFTELGSIAFDFGYAEAAQLPLVGHPYNHNVEDFGAIAEPFAANYGVGVKPGIMDARDIDGSMLNDEILYRMTMRDLENLACTTEKERNRYQVALRAFRLSGSDRELMEAKSRLDEYLISLADQVRSSDLARFKAGRKAIRRIRSQIFVMERAGAAVCTFAVAGGAWNDWTRQTLMQTGHGLLILAGLGAVAMSTSKQVTQGKQRLQSNLKHEETRLRKTRPASIYVMARGSR